MITKPFATRCSDQNATYTEYGFYDMPFAFAASSVSAFASGKPFST